MDEWINILLLSESLWQESREKLIAAELTIEEYCISRDLYKARRIFDLYGYEHFRRFVDRCPHIIHLLDEYVPCKYSPE